MEVISPGTKGAIGELRVSVDLLQRGFDVYRAVSPSCRVDLLALRGDAIFKVEVKTGSRNTAQDKINVCVSSRQAGRFDVLAVIDPASGDLVYMPMTGAAREVFGPPAVAVYVGYTR